MDYFYEEQLHRLEYLNHEPILFVDLLCQMNDMIKPTGTEAHFHLSHLQKFQGQIGVFFNCLINLNKFIAYETRDLFAIKHQHTEFPDYSQVLLFALTSMLGSGIGLQKQNMSGSLWKKKVEMTLK